MRNIKITAREIVEFVHSGGDLTSEFKSNKRAVQGIEAHAFLQKQYTEEDRKEVKVNTTYEDENYSIVIGGRMDGLLLKDGKLTIEEIKSTTVDLDLMDIDTRPEHLSQAKMYAYMYCTDNELKSINVKLTYITIDKYVTKSFTKRYNMTQLKRFFNKTVGTYIAWLEVYYEHQRNKLKSLEGLTFPFPEYREGQYKFMGAVYQTFIEKGILYSIAPTGIGKTIAGLYSGLKTIKNEKEKIFYLTAKNAGKKIVVDTVNLLKEKGLVCKTVVVNSKESMCLMDKVDCDPEICPYAKGFFDRLNPALKDIFVHKDVYESKLISDYGEFHKICPYEFSLAISNFSDIVICDYNYAFDPITHLIRYFDEEYYSPKLLVDEAHNMIDRSRSMYSSFIQKSSILALKKSVKGLKPSVHSQINKLVKYIDEFVETNDIIKAQFYHQDDLDYDLTSLVERITLKLEQILAENKKFKTREQVLNGYFELGRFLKISDFYNSKFRLVYEIINDDIVISIRCLDASEFILDTINRRAEGVAFFSATLEPVDYYVKLISNGEGKSIQIPSPFKQDHLGVFVDDSTSTRYRDRVRSVDQIIDSIYAMLESKIGNYIVFFPSYAYLNQVLEHFESEDYHMLVQERNMTTKTRKVVLDEFGSVGTVSKVGFFVLGGSFSEGIDYIGEMLSGVLIVGVALPQYNRYNELLKSYFDEEFGQGFDYAYTYPGMNKVIQAVGRVIRTDDDIGIAILFDDRYSHRKYKTLFPRNWNHYKTVDNNTFLQTYLDKFWKK
ncbi:ATP-dependent DNA helicase [Candidatus Izimaplasma bacterium]|nr:ATP-dependent DNA helicase [Candidatus Izimaplasma bacterium]